MFAHLTDAQFNAVQVSNQSDDEVFIPANRSLGQLEEARDEGCFRMAVEDTYRAAQPANRWNKTLTTQITDSCEEKLPNGITVFRA